MKDMANTSSNLLKSKSLQAAKEKEMLIKGILIAFIGALILLAPHFMAPTELRDILASSYLVGWFSLLLGGVFVAQVVARRWAKQ
jgi:VIT1/CCC1 family predicted Fe2+/Mn2+ transporter